MLETRKQQKYISVETSVSGTAWTPGQLLQAHAPIKGDRYGAGDRQNQKTLVYSAQEERMRRTVVRQQDIFEVDEHKKSICRVACESDVSRLSGSPNKKHLKLLSSQTQFNRMKEISVVTKNNEE